jgi:hypothetical protein
MKRKLNSVPGNVRPPRAAKIPLDHILFRGGTALTAFQSIGLFLIGLAFVLLTGVPIFVYEFGLVQYERHWGMILGAGVMSLWGLVMMFNGAAASLRLLRKKQD